MQRKMRIRKYKRHKNLPIFTANWMLLKGWCYTVYRECTEAGSNSPWVLSLLLNEWVETQNTNSTSSSKRTNSARELYKKNDNGRWSDVISSFSLTIMNQLRFGFQHWRTKKCTYQFFCVSVLFFGIPHIYYTNNNNRVHTRRMKWKWKKEEKKTN